LRQEEKDKKPDGLLQQEHSLAAGWDSVPAAGFGVNFTVSVSFFE